MSTAPKNAVYIWPNAMLNCPLGIAKSLNRNDLTIIPKERVTREFFMGREFNDVVIDHATVLTGRQRAIILESKVRARLRAES